MIMECTKGTISEMKWLTLLVIIDIGLLSVLKNSYGIDDVDLVKFLGEVNFYNTP